MSREMQLYVKRLLEDYAKRDATSSWHTRPHVQAF